jgi:hypothetical protein
VAGVPEAPSGRRSSGRPADILDRGGAQLAPPRTDVGIGSHAPAVVQPRGGEPDMSLVYDERGADSPLVRTVWRTRNESDGVYMASADGSWDLLVVKQDTITDVLLAGPSSRARPIPYVAGSEYLGIRFPLGIFPRDVPASQLLDRAVVLPRVGKARFYLGGATWPIPTYDNVETLVAHLVRREVVLRDGVVADALARGTTPAPCARSVQRHFLRTTGLTHDTIRQIERARRAMALLQRGTAILSVVHDAGFSDQPHLTKSLKRFMGQTPGQILAAGTPRADGVAPAQHRTHW